jgi:hypothetical protein
MKIAGIRGTVGLGAVLALGMGLALALPTSEARANHCGDTGSNVDEARSAAVEISNDFGSESICPALCRRRLARCRYLARREIGCHRGNIAQRLAAKQLECRLEDSGKDRQVCRANHRSEEADSLSNVRSEFRQMLEDCESAVEDNCICSD